MPAYLGRVKGFWNFRLLLIIAAMCLVTAAHAVLRPVEHRYLFILETSKEMKREAEPARNVLLQLLYSGVMGQMRAGDTFGIWTYNDKLQAGYPMQTYVWEDREMLTTRAGEYLKAQKFTGAARLENALLPLLKLATNSPDLTVILVSDGTQAVAGTPFDQEIRALHKKYHDELYEAKLPFVTVLVAYKGEFVSYAVNSALGPIRVPRLPKPAAVTNVVDAPIPAAPVKRGESLILRGPLPKNKTETVPVAVAPAVVTPEAPKTTEAPKVEAASTAPPTPATTSPALPSVSTVTANATNTVAIVSSVAPPQAPVVVQTPETPAVQPVKKSEEETKPAVKEQASNVATFTVQPTNETSPSTPASPATAPVSPKAEDVTASAPAAPAMLAQTEAPSSLRKVLIVIGVLLFLILLVLVLMLRKTKSAQPSLITQSIDKSVP